VAIASFPPQGVLLGPDLGPDLRYGPRVVGMGEDRRPDEIQRDTADDERSVRRLTRALTQAPSPF